MNTMEKEKYEEWLKSLKEGDVVFVESYFDNALSRLKITKVTKCFIIINGVKYKNGDSVGTSFYGSKLMPIDDIETIKRYTRQCIIANTRSHIGNMYEMRLKENKNLSIDDLKSAEQLLSKAYEILSEKGISKHE